jgi:hypothetical protein
MNLSARAFLSLIGLMVCQYASASDAIVVKGKLISNEPMTYLANECPDPDICLHRWWKAVIDVDKTVRGTAISGRVIAAVSQHAPMKDGYQKTVRYFVLEAIDDPEAKRKLQADYYLDEASPDLPKQ